MVFVLWVVMLGLGTALGNSNWWATGHNDNSHFLLFSGLLSTLFVVILFVIAFLCGKKKQKWFVIAMMGGIAYYICSRITMFYLGAYKFPLLIFLISIFGSVAFVTPVKPFLIMIVQNNPDNLSPFILLLYLFFIGSYFWGRKTSHPRDLTTEEIKKPL